MRRYEGLIERRLISRVKLDEVGPSSRCYQAQCEASRVAWLSHVSEQTRQIRHVTGGFAMISLRRTPGVAGEAEGRQAELISGELTKVYQNPILRFNIGTVPVS